MKFYKFFLFLIVIYFVNVSATPCTTGLKRALQEEGLSKIQIKLICEKATLYDKSLIKHKHPNEIKLANDLVKSLNWRRDPSDVYRNEYVEFVDCKKQNGLSPSQNEYILEFTGHVKAIQPFYSVPGTWPLHTQLNRFYKSSAIQIKTGQILEIKVKAKYVLTEKGWRIENIDAPMITANNKLEIFRVNEQY